MHPSNFIHSILYVFLWGYIITVDLEVQIFIIILIKHTGKREKQMFSSFCVVQTSAASSQSAASLSQSHCFGLISLDHHGQQGQSLTTNTPH